MELIITGLSRAMLYEPSKPTLAIRIFSSYNGFSDPDLQKSELYKFTGKYLFDDIWPGFAGSKSSVMINEDIATKILTDFNNNYKNCESVLVHCSRGKNRSPAVAIALNQIFKLGYNMDELRKKYSESNWYVADMIIDTARKLKFD
jgi:predicted protein tyrosine phosphatase